jgi:hypothetical protein
VDREQEIRFKEKKLVSDTREIEMFYYSFSGAQIFFRD